MQSLADSLGSKKRRQIIQYKEEQKMVLVRNNWWKDHCQRMHIRCGMDPE